MCQKCDDAQSVPAIPRRNFLKLAAAVAAGGIFSHRVFAESPVVPKPANAISPDEALDRLMKGNERYVNGKMTVHDFLTERPALTEGQNPFASILSCADSRIGPEYTFDTGRGDIFVCRVAGNFADINSIASFEYSVAVLGSPLIMVLGHSRCGAVGATIKAVKDNESFPGHIPSLIGGIRPAVEAVLSEPGDLLENATKKNVLLAVKTLQSASPILDKAIADGKLKVVGAMYDLTDGRVDLL